MTFEFVSPNPTPAQILEDEVIAFVRKTKVTCIPFHDMEGCEAGYFSENDEKFWSMKWEKYAPDFKVKVYEEVTSPNFDPVVKFHPEGWDPVAGLKFDTKPLEDLLAAAKGEKVLDLTGSAEEMLEKLRTLKLSVRPEEGQIIMDDPEAMVRSIKEHVEKTGDEIESADDMFRPGIGFRAIGPKGVVSWMVPLRSMRNYTWDNQALKESFQTSEGRETLAQVLSTAHIQGLKKVSSCLPVFDLSCEEKDLLGFKRDNLLHKQLPIYDLDVPIGVVYLDAEGQVRVTPCEKGRWDGTPFLKLQDPKATAKAYLDTLRPQYEVGPDWILAPGQGTFVFDTETGKSLFFCVDNPILYLESEADPLAPDSTSYTNQGYWFKTMEEALRVASDGRGWRRCVRRGSSLEPVAFLQWKEDGRTCTSKGGALPPPHLEYKIVQNPHQTEEPKPAETSEPETNSLGGNSLGGLFGFAIGTALLASSLKKSESPETRVVPQGEASEDILALEAGERATSVRRDSKEE